MKTIKYVVLLLFYVNFGIVPAQNKTAGLIKYEGRMNMIDTVANSILMEYSLLFNNTESTFFYLGATGQIKTDGTIIPLAGSDGSHKKKMAQQYQNFNNKTITSIGASIGTNYLVRDEMTPISWKLSKNTKKVQNIDCFSAQAEYRGRVWTAWYAPSIPISSGPWKLYGLPGMILEAEDIKGLIKFECTAITIPPPTDVVVEIPKSKDNKTNENPISTQAFGERTKKDIENAEKMSKIKSGQNYYPVRDIEIFYFEETKSYMKRKQQKLSDIPKK